MSPTSHGQAIIDISADPLAARSARRQAVLRIGVPILGVVLVIAVIAVIAFETTRANRRGALELADHVLAATDARIAEEVTNYFAIPVRALQEGATLSKHEQAGDARRKLVEHFSMAVMEHVPQIADFIVGDAGGNFMMFRRADNGGIDTKLIQNEPGPRKVVWIRRNAAGEEIGRDEDPSDTYDPRTRSWYSGALATSGVFWTDVYVFFTAREPGITASTRYQSPEGLVFVGGVDVTLADLSKFLAGLKIGENGRAMIIDDQGRIIAYPQADRIVKHDSTGPMTARVDEIGDDAAAGAFDRFRVGGPGRKTITVGGQRYLTSMTPLPAVGRNWSVMTVVPEGDFVGFVERNNRIALLMSLGIIALSVIGAALLVRQGLRGDRAARLVRERAHAMARQSEALELVSDEADTFDPTHPEEAQTLTEVAAEIAKARLANLWYLLHDRNVVHCTDSFDSETSRHAAGFEVHRDEVPHFFDLVAAGTAVEAEDAANDPKTAEVYRLTMAPLGTRSLISIPMRHRGHAVGALTLHDAVDITGTRHCLRVLATMAALRAPHSAAQPHSAQAEAVAVAEPDEAHSRIADLTLDGIDVGASGEAQHPGVAVLVVHIDEQALPANGSAGIPELLDEITCAMQEVATQQNIPYLKLVGYDIIGAAGFSPDDATATSRIANAAVAGRDRLAALYEDRGLTPTFRIGIDSGPAIGRSVGANPRVFNLWGEALRTAQTMAASALPSTIQASEAAYLRLRQGFLLRPRGTFYLPAVGASQTFVLAERL